MPAPSPVSRLPRRSRTCSTRTASENTAATSPTCASSGKHEVKTKLQIEGNVFALAAPGAGLYSRTRLDELAEKAKSQGARGTYFVQVAANGLKSSVEKLIGAENVKKLVEITGAKPSDLVVAVSAKEQIKGTEAAALIAGQLRLQLGEALNLIDKSQWKFLWITGCPLFEWSESDKH